MSFSWTWNPILIVSAEKALVNKGQIFQILYKILQEVIFNLEMKILRDSSWLKNWAFY